MKIVFYDDSRVASEVMENVDGIVVDGNSIRYSGGEMGGIVPHFIIVDDDVQINVGDTVSDDLIALDRTHLLRRKDVRAEEQVKHVQVLLVHSLLNTETKGSYYHFFRDCWENGVIGENELALAVQVNYLSQDEADIIKTLPSERSL